MTPQSLPELETPAFRRAIAVALGLPIDGEAPRAAAQDAVVVGDAPPKLPARVVSPRVGAAEAERAA